MKFRWFPWLGFKTLTDEEKDVYEIPRHLTVKALTFAWAYLNVILVGKVFDPNGGVNGD